MLRLNIFADYFQLWLEAVEAKPLPRDFRFEDRHLRERVWTDTGLLILFTARNMIVPVEVEIAASAPEDDFAAWDHVVEASIATASGQFELSGCGGFNPHPLDVAPGSYRVRMYHQLLGSLSEDGLNGSDQYRIVLWNSSSAGMVVLKQWPDTPITAVSSAP